MKKRWAGTFRWWTLSPYFQKKIKPEIIQNMTTA